MGYTEEEQIAAGCRLCGREFLFPATKEQKEALIRHWKTGEGYIQEILPHLQKEERELFISGICGECWTGLFGVPDGKKRREE